MTVRIEIIGADGVDAIAQLKQLAGNYAAETPTVKLMTPEEATPPVAHIEPKEPANEKPAEPKVRKVREKKQPVVEAHADNSDIPDTLEGAKVIIRRLAASDGAEGNNGGIEKAKELLRTYGVASTADLGDDQESILRLIKECKEKLAAGGFASAKKAEPKGIFD